MEMISHLPEVGILAPFQLGAFEITHLPFEIFSELDEDWAHESYYKMARPVFAIRRDMESRPSDEAIQDLIMLIYYAILLGSGNEYPIPMLSVTYFRMEGRCSSRRIGAADRSFILHNNSKNSIGPLQVSIIQEIYGLCQKANLHWNDPVFFLVKALGDIYSQNVSEQYAALPLIVALEIHLVGSKPQDRIISRMIDAVSSKLNVDASSSIRKIYSWRSDILHGRKTKFPNATHIFEELKNLTYALTIQNLREQEKHI